MVSSAWGKERSARGADPWAKNAPPEPFRGGKKSLAVKGRRSKGKKVESSRRDWTRGYRSRVSLALRSRTRDHGHGLGGVTFQGEKMSAAAAGLGSSFRVRSRGGEAFIIQPQLQRFEKKMKMFKNGEKKRDSAV